MKIKAALILAILGLSLLGAAFTFLTAEAQKEVVLRTHGWWQPPPSNRFNPFAPGAISLVGLVYERLAFWIKATNEYYPELAKSWDVDLEAGKVTVHLRENVVWHDGTPFTARDVWTTLMIYKAFNRPVWNYISDVRVVDDYTVEYIIKKPAFLLLHYILYVDGLIVAPYHIYGKYAEAIAQATSEEELNQIRAQLIDFEPETIIGTGPFKFDRITSSELILTKFEDYWGPKKIFIDKIIMPYIVSNEVGWQYYLAGELDFDVFQMTPEVFRSVEEAPFADAFKISDLSGFALVFNFDNEWLRIPEVRKAIAYIIDREKVANAAGAGLFVPDEDPTGLLEVTEDQWISDLIQAGAIEKYEHDPAKAEQLLMQAGFTKQGDAWYTPTGERFKLVMIAPGGWTDWVLAMTEVAEELSAFGIDVELRTPESPSYWSDEWYLGGNYDLAIDFYGAWMVYPWAAMERMWVQVNNRDRSIVQGENFPTELELPFFGETVNVRDLVETLATSFNPAEQRDAAKKLAYAVNYWLPQLPIAEKQLTVYINTRNFVWPSPDISANYIYLYQNIAGGHQEALAFMIKQGAVVPNPDVWGVTVTLPPETVITTVTVEKPSPTTVPGPERTVTTTVTKTETSPVTTTVTETSTGALVAVLIVGIIIGAIAMFFARR